MHPLYVSLSIYLFIYSLPRSIQTRISLLYFSCNVFQQYYGTIIFFCTFCSASWSFLLSFFLFFIYLTIYLQISYYLLIQYYTLNYYTEIVLKVLRIIKSSHLSKIIPIISFILFFF